MTGVGMLLAVWLWGASPNQPVTLEDVVDVVEVNHLYDLSGSRPRHVVDQLIFWDWDPTRQAHVVRAFRVIRDPDQYPQRDHTRDDYVCLWYDLQGLRQVRAKSFRESWTDTDPEVTDRIRWRHRQRRGLLNEWVPEYYLGEMLRHLLE